MTQANYTVTVLERLILPRLDDLGYTLVPRNPSTAARILGQSFFTRKFHVCHRIYATDQYGDFICYHYSRG